MNNSELLSSWLKIIIALPVVLILAYLSIKLSRNYTNSFRKGSYVKVIETIPVYNKSALSIVKIGNRYFVLGVSEQEINIIAELTQDEIIQMEQKKEDMQKNYSNISMWMTKLKDKTDWRHDK